MNDNWIREGVIHSKLNCYKKKVKKTRILISNILDKFSNSAIAYSYGKDSTVLLHIARQINPQIKAFYINQGAETKDTVFFRENFPTDIYGSVEALEPLHNFENAAIKFNWFAQDYLQQNDISNAEWHKIITANPSDGYCRLKNISCIFLGIRADESSGRKKLLKYYKQDLMCTTTTPPRSYPLLIWNVNDIWAYIASNNLPYNPTYDREVLGFTRKEIRVSPLLCFGGWLSHGVKEWIRVSYPEIINDYKNRFPMWIY